MSPRIQSIWTDPLAGCLPIFQDAASASTMIRGLLLRLRLFHSEAVCNSIADQIIVEVALFPIPKYEYVINEIQHEMRRAGRDYDPRYEEVLLNSWTKDLLKRFPEDDVWLFVKKIRGLRTERKR